MNHQKLAEILRRDDADQPTLVQDRQGGALALGTTFMDSVEVRRFGHDAVPRTAAVTDIEVRATRPYTTRSRETEVVVRQERRCAERPVLGTATFAALGYLSVFNHPPPSVQVCGPLSGSAQALAWYSAAVAVTIGLIVRDDLAEHGQTLYLSAWTPSADASVRTAVRH